MNLLALHRLYSVAANALPFTVAMLVGTIPVSAQCTNPWLPGNGLPGLLQVPFGPTALVNAMTHWDPDGPGPATPVVVVAGDFEAAGAAVANDIAAYDPATGSWSVLGSGTDGSVHALATLPSGDLVAGGDFSIMDGVSVNSIARWNGTSWSPLGSGVSPFSTVIALATRPNGELVAGGNFTTAGGTIAGCIARWNGASWAALGSGFGPLGLCEVMALANLANGDLVAGGNFATAGGVSANNIARWNGTSWSALGAGTDDRVRAVTTLANGDLIAAGDFSTAGGVSGTSIARWNGVSWSALGSGIPAGSFVQALARRPNGDLVASGFFASAGGVSASRIATWNGSSWAALGSGMDNNGTAKALATLANGDLLAGGSFPTAGGVRVDGLARWNGTSWSALGSGVNWWVTELATLANGDVVVAGPFTVAGSVSANGVARWNGTTWSAFGSGVGGPAFGSPSVYAIAELPNGDIIAGGDFSTAGGTNASNIARWNGTAWFALGSGTNAIVNAVRTLPNGDIIAGGNFTIAGGVTVNCVARWNGTSWSALGAGMSGLPGPRVLDLAILPNGDLVAGGHFTAAGGVTANNIARWNGTSWSPIGAGLNAWVAALATLPNGDLVAGGYFTTAGGVSAQAIARWNGASWSAMGSGLGSPGLDGVIALAVLPNGDLMAGGTFSAAGGTNVNNVARWNGTAWSAFGLGTEGSVFTLAARPNGDVVVGGNFLIAGGSSSAHFAQLTTTCPASAVAAGTGCVGSGGPNVLTATALPWVGGTFASQATGLPANSLAIGVRGLGIVSIPLAAILPQGGAGCALLVSPDLLDLYLPTAGAVTTSFAVPNSMVLVSQVLHQQVVPIEFTALGNIATLTSTNRLTLTIGSF